MQKNTTHIYNDTKSKLMVLTARFPYPLEKGDKLRVFNHIKVLSKKFEIVLISLSDKSIHPSDYEEVKQYCSRIYTFHRSKLMIAKNILLAFKNGLPFQIGYFFDKGIQSEIHKIVKKEKPNHIFCQLVRTAEFVRHLDIPKTIDYMDTFSIGAKRWADNSSAIIQPVLHREAKKLVAYENAVFDDFDFHTIISEQDRDYLQMKDKHKVKIVPNGVDMTFFQPIPKAQKKYDIAFVGNMGYVPNVEGARYIVETLLPKLKKHFPTIKILIAGARPTALVQSFASENVTVTGWIEDIRDAYASAKIFVAPLFLGSGQQNKILEAMSMKIPCITTTLVNNAIGAKSNEAIILADDENAFVEKIKSLLNNQNQIDNISQRGLEFVKNNYSWEHYVKPLEECFLVK
ncbi:MAG: glycosyltransferase [Saprospiraceae bacterium]